MKRIFLCSLLTCLSTGHIFGAASSSQCSDYIPRLPSLQLLCTNALMEDKLRPVPSFPASQADLERAEAMLEQIPGAIQELTQELNMLLPLDEVRGDGRTHTQHIDLVANEFRRYWHNLHHRHLGDLAFTEQMDRERRQAITDFGAFMVGWGVLTLKDIMLSHLPNKELLEIVEKYKEDLLPCIIEMYEKNPELTGERLAQELFERFESVLSDKPEWAGVKALDQLRIAVRYGLPLFTALVGYYSVLKGERTHNHQLKIIGEGYIAGSAANLASLLSDQFVPAGLRLLGHQDSAYASKIISPLLQFPVGCALVYKGEEGENKRMTYVGSLLMATAGLRLVFEGGKKIASALFK